MVIGSPQEAGVPLRMSVRLVINKSNNQHHSDCVHPNAFGYVKVWRIEKYAVSYLQKVLFHIYKFGYTYRLFYSADQIID